MRRGAAPGPTARLTSTPTPCRAMRPSGVRSNRTARWNAVSGSGKPSEPAIRPRKNTRSRPRRTSRVREVPALPVLYCTDSDGPVLHTERQEHIMRYLKGAAVLACIAVVAGLLSAVVQTQANPRIGTWKLDLSRSTYQQGEAPAKETRTYLE